MTSESRIELMEFLAGCAAYAEDDEFHRLRGFVRVLRQGEGTEAILPSIKDFLAARARQASSREAAEITAHLRSVETALAA